MTGPYRSAAPLRLIVSGGGTGGHVYPALTAVRALQARSEAAGGTVEVLWVGDPDGLEAGVVVAEGIEFRGVATGRLRRSSNPLRLASPKNVADMARVPVGVAQARGIVSGWRPDVVLSTGGYVSVPVGIVARLCGVPLVIHEQTRRLGLANRALAHVATRVAVSSESTLELLPEAARARAVVTGNPVRPEIMAGDPAKAITGLGLGGFRRGVPTVYVTGGSQGSAQINELLLVVLPWLLSNANVVHQCGPDRLSWMQQHTADLPADLTARYLLTGYVGAELPDVLAFADLVISRSGAGTIAELTALGRPSILIPLASSAGDEQAHNARHLDAAGAAVALTGDDVMPESLRAAAGPLLTDTSLRTKMAHRARSLGQPDAADRLVNVLLDVAAAPEEDTGEDRSAVDRRPGRGKHRRP